MPSWTGVYQVGSLLQLNIFFIILVHKMNWSSVLREPDQGGMQNDGFIIHCDHFMTSTNRLSSQAKESDAHSITLGREDTV
jgi:hypothetical protein